MMHSRNSWKRVELQKNTSQTQKIYMKGHSEPRWYWAEGAVKTSRFLGCTSLWKLLAFAAESFAFNWNVCVTTTQLDNQFIHLTHLRLYSYENAKCIWVKFCQRDLSIPREAFSSCNRESFSFCIKSLNLGIPQGPWAPLSNARSTVCILVSVKIEHNHQFIWGNFLR